MNSASPLRHVVVLTDELSGERPIFLRPDSKIGSRLSGPNHKWIRGVRTVLNDRGDAAIAAMQAVGRVAKEEILAVGGIENYRFRSKPLLEYFDFIALENFPKTSIDGETSLKSAFIILRNIKYRFITAMLSRIGVLPWDSARFYSFLISRADGIDAASAKNTFDEPKVLRELVLVVGSLGVSV